MPDSTIIQNEYATLVFHIEKKIIHHTFHKPIGGDNYREVLNTGIRMLEKHQASKWLSDERGNSALSPEDTDWSKTNWFPRALNAGWKYWALVVPQDILARLNLKEFVDSYLEQGIVIAVFTEPGRAMQWLTVCDQPAKKQSTNAAT